MIYLIGGTPRVGKTTLAKILMERKAIPFVSADVLSHALDRAYPNLEIRSGGWASIPDKFYTYLREFIKSSTHNLPDYIIEGDSFFPEHVKKLSEEFQIKSVFLGASHTTLDLIKSNVLHSDWVSTLPQEKQEKLPEWLMSTSEMFKKEAEKHNIRYFDVSEGREKILEEAFTYLIK
jgi:2-phosphoglycerate kinase